MLQTNTCQSSPLPTIHTNHLPDRGQKCAVFTDYKVGIQKHKCTNPECDWQSAPTTTSVFGTSIHPDLAIEDDLKEKLLKF